MKNYIIFGGVSYFFNFKNAVSYQKFPIHIVLTLDTKYEKFNQNYLFACIDLLPLTRDGFTGGVIDGLQGQGGGGGGGLG